MSQDFIGHIFAVDPDSNVCGWACLTHNGDIVEYGRSKPEPKRDRPGVNSDYIERAASMAAEIWAVCNCLDCRLALIESPAKTAKAIYHNGKRVAQEGQAYYGAAFGIVWMVLSESGIETRDVPADVWTRGKNKERRAMELHDANIGYDMFGDKGYHAADAIGLALWWLTEQRVRQSGA